MPTRLVALPAPHPRWREKPGEGASIAGDRVRCPRFHGAIALENIGAEHGEPRATAAAAADSGRHQLAAEGVVHLLDEDPRPAIRHAELTARGRNRSGSSDGGEQIGLAGAERGAGAENYAQSKAIFRHTESRDRFRPG